MKKNDLMTENDLGWRVHTPNLLNEILVNKECAILKIPLTIFSTLLQQVGKRASELNDKELNKLMLRLTIYEIADPHSPNYDSKLVSKILKS